MNYPAVSALSVKQFCIRYNLSPASAYRLMGSGKLPYRKVGRRRLISVADAEEWWDSLPHSPSCPPLIPSPPIQPDLAGDMAKPGRLRVARCHACGRDLINCKEVDHA